MLAVPETGSDIRLKTEGKKQIAQPHTVKLHTKELMVKTYLLFIF